MYCRNWHEPWNATSISSTVTWHPGSKQLRHFSLNSSQNLCIFANMSSASHCAREISSMSSNHIAPSNWWKRRSLITSQLILMPNLSPAQASSTFIWPDWWSPIAYRKPMTARISTSFVHATSQFRAYCCRIWVSFLFIYAAILPKIPLGPLVMKRWNVSNEFVDWIAARGTGRVVNTSHSMFLSPGLCCMNHLVPSRTQKMDR